MSGILAQFETLGATKIAIERLRAEGHSDLDVYSPFPAPELEQALGIVSSPVRRWALIGGITGFLTAAGLTGLTALAYPLVTQGQPILSWPAYFVIMFEMTILFTGLFGFLGVLHHTRKPGRLSPQYRTTFSVDRFGVYVPAAAGADQRGVESLVRDAGAVEVEVGV
jgi:Alternative complex III, ActD subunit